MWWTNPGLMALISAVPLDWSHHSGRDLCFPNIYLLLSPGRSQVKYLRPHTPLEPAQMNSLTQGRLGAMEACWVCRQVPASQDGWTAGGEQLIWATGEFVGFQITYKLFFKPLVGFIFWNESFPVHLQSASCAKDGYKDANGSWKLHLGYTQPFTFVPHSGHLWPCDDAVMKFSSCSVRPGKYFTCEWRRSGGSGSSNAAHINTWIHT